jgi:4-hydroxy-tetrahydrodipicolinate synthase
MEWSENLEGALFPAVPVPFKEDGSPDFKAQEDYAAWMVKQDIDGVAVWSHTGRGLHLDKKTRAEVFKCWREAIGSMRRLIAGVGPSPDATPDNAIASAMKMAEEAKGADFLLVYPPACYADLENSGKSVIDYHRELSKPGIPLLLFYLNPKMGGVFYSEDVLDELLGMPEVAGIKMATLDSPLTLQDVVTHILINHPGKVILTGEDRLYGYSLYRGCHGALVGLGASCVNLQREMIDSWFVRELDRFLQLSRLVDHLSEVVFVEPMDGYIGRLLFKLSYLGIIPEESAHDPWGPPVTPIEKEFIKATVDLLREKCDV